MKSLHENFVRKSLTLILSMVILITFLTVTINVAAEGIEWETTLHIQEIGGKLTNVVFGEATDAHDGPPADTGYDQPLPPEPMKPYIQAWFNDNLPGSFSQLMKDYRHYPGQYKIWNLTVLWEPKTGNIGTTITLSWDPSSLSGCEYASMTLQRQGNINLTWYTVAEMTTDISFTYIQDSYEISPGVTVWFLEDNFRIIANSPPQITDNTPSTATTGDSFTFTADIVDPSGIETVWVEYWYGSGTHTNVSMLLTGGDIYEKTITMDDTTETLHYILATNDTSNLWSNTGINDVTVVDNDAPSIDSITGDTSGTTGESVTITVTFSDNVEVTEATLFYKAASAGAFTFVSIMGGSYDISLPVDSVESWYYYVTVDDAAGNGPVGSPSVDGSSVYTITVTDNDDPVITGSSGNVNVDTGATVTLWVAATDDIDVTGAEITIDSGSPEGMTWDSGDARYEYDFPDDGADHTYSMRVFDAAGNDASVGPFTIVAVDTEAPSIDSITGDTSGTTGESVTISVTFSDNVGVTEALLYYKLASAGAFTFVSIMGGSYDISLPVDSVESWYYYVTVDDAAGNGPVGSPSVDGSVYYTITVSDNDDPSLIDNSPTTGSPGGTYTFDVTPTDNIGISSVTVTWSHGVLDGTDVSMVPDGDGTWSLDISLDTSMDDMTYTITVTDTAMNTFTDSMKIVNVVNTYTIPLVGDWNLISIPFDEVISKTTFIIRYNSIDYSWNEAVTAGIIINDVYDYDRALQQYTSAPWDVNDFNPGEGYWVFAYFDCELIVTGSNPGTVQITELQQEWNLIGLPLGTDVASGDLIVKYDGTDYTWAEALTDSNPTGDPLVLKFLYPWDSATQFYTTTTTLEPGNGYWIYSYQDCILKTS